jgi:hypothetical protein
MEWRYFAGKKKKYHAIKINDINNIQVNSPTNNREEIC